ncbi:MAG: hypothetical protein ABH879_10870 [archaeon]
MGLFKNVTEEVSDGDLLAEGRVLCRFIIEVLGKPEDYANKTLKKYVEGIRGDKRFKIVNEHFADPQPQEGLFSVFAELEAWVKDVPSIVEFCFDYMPSSVEIIQPDKIGFVSSELAGLLNDLQAKLHNVDMMLKNARRENEILKQNANGLLKNIVVLSLGSGEKTAAEISRNVGVPEKQLKPFLDKFIEKGTIKKVKDKYQNERPEKQG